MLTGPPPRQSGGRCTDRIPPARVLFPFVQSSTRPTRSDSSPSGATMARINILKNGTATPYFWSDKDKTVRTAKTVYKKTATGVKRMTGVHFNAVTKSIEKH
jgi:hypothetical protein